MKFTMKNHRLLQVLSLVLVLSFVHDDVTAFSLRPKLPSTTTGSSLFLAKKSSAANKKKKGRPSTSGFGGAAADICPCGSDLPYMKCSCSKLHKKNVMLVHKETTPEQIVRARYTAYAKREIDFIIKTTHPKNKNFITDIQHWRKQIDMNCYDNFELTKCEILDETIEDDKIATVTFVANMIQRDSREKTAFMEKSTFEKIGGAWLYKEGTIGDPPGRETTSTDDDEEKDDEEKQEQSVADGGETVTIKE